ncbi:MAG: 16S rRNA (adenine(1518)-N(6)/adenine(1519)-N(6))-dimethyltransferase RsmA [Planctomycetaceae bacterium]
MKNADRQTRSYLMGLFAEQGIHPRGDLGQNFLVDLNLMEFIIRAAGLQPSDVVLEIGAGTGGMTSMMAPHVARVLSVEIDPHMHAMASQATEQFDNVTLLKTDALKNKNRLSPIVVEQLEEFLAEVPDPEFKLVANLPYSVATPVISNIVASSLPWSTMIVTIQWELAQKMAATPEQSGYGALAIWLQSQCRVKILKKLKPTVFWPRPKVDSAIVRLEPLQSAPWTIDDRRFFQDFVRRLFTQRRKLLRSVLASMYRKLLTKPQVDALLAGLGLKDDARAENLDIPRMVTLSNAFQQAVGGAMESDEVSTETALADESDPALETHVIDEGEVENDVPTDDDNDDEF